MVLTVISQLQIFPKQRAVPYFSKQISGNLGGSHLQVVPFFFFFVWGEAGDLLMYWMGEIEQKMKYWGGCAGCGRPVHKGTTGHEGAAITGYSCSNCASQTFLEPESWLIL